MVDTQILTPVILLVAWSQIMWLWMYLTRIPAIKAANMQLDPEAPRGQQMASLPSKVRWKADNYNHLMEQPTIFYAIVFALSLLEEGDGLNLVMAWAYVLIRIVHSLFQATVNKIEVRFTLFVLSNIALFVLAANALVVVLFAS